ncbi:MAG: nicotinate phosphoribosyltransferase, partial [Clostridia bacterium]|nr:nicotinate phosphoribosyltransferase [Clostridia bacterium]
MDERNLTLLMDFYELTMGNGYFMNGLKDREAVFDAYFRVLPDKGGFAIMAGLEQVIAYMEDLHFT